VDEVVVGTNYTPDFELLEKLNCGFYAHGDDPCFDHNGVDLTLMFKERGMFKVFKRTEGVSTTDITGRLLSLCEDLMKKDQ
jgi:ethanolamine-phosphate cytidylyltransferase